MDEKAIIDKLLLAAKNSGFFNKTWLEYLIEKSEGLTTIREFLLLEAHFTSELESDANNILWVLIKELIKLL